LIIVSTHKSLLKCETAVPLQPALPTPPAEGTTDADVDVDIPEAALGSWRAYLAQARQHNFEVCGWTKCCCSCFFAPHMHAGSVLLYI
jgi:hypothetical protein